MAHDPGHVGLDLPQFYIGIESFDNEYGFEINDLK